VDEVKVAQWQRGEFTISTDRERLDLDVIHGFLSTCYWAEGIPRQTVERSIRHSIPFGIYHQAAAGERQVGFGRVISDQATFAYLADVFVLEEYRGRGLGAWLVEVMVAHPDLQSLRRWALVTRDAHDLYQRFGWRALAAPERSMERVPESWYARDREEG
jgi:GNAT superfamily N-acetyltransferase